MTTYRENIGQGHVPHLSNLGPGRAERSEDGYLVECSRDSFSQAGLQNIEEHHPMSSPSLASYAPPETPQEPMEFLSRSWSISAVDVHRALAPVSGENRKPGMAIGANGANGAVGANGTNGANGANGSPDAALDTAPFKFASGVTSQLVMDRVLTSGTELSPFTSRRNSHSSGPLSLMSPPVSPRGSHSIQPNQYLPHRQSFGLGQRGGKSVGRWLKDMKERKKEINRTRKAQVHAAVTVAGVAAAIAAVAAATAANSNDEQSTRTAMAMASAAALVAAQCVEVAESMGADREQMAAIVSSAVSVKSAGDILTMTASAATALRGAATLRQRTLKDNRYSVATVMPYERSSELHSSPGNDRCTTCQPAVSYTANYVVDEDSEIEYSTHEILARGTEFLKRTRNGEVQWRMVYVYLNKKGQVVLNLQSKMMGGALKKNKKSIVLHVYPDIPAWPGRQLLENGDHRRYFALKTTKGDEEFESRSVAEHHLWTEGVKRLLCVSNRYCRQ